MRNTQRLDISTGEAVPEEYVFLHYPLSNNPMVNMKYIPNCDRFRDFMRKLHNIHGAYVGSIVNVGYDPAGSNDAYAGYYTYDSTRDYAVTLDFFDIEKMTFSEAEYRSRMTCMSMMTAYG